MVAALDQNSLLKCGFSKLIQEDLREEDFPSIIRSSQSSHLSLTRAEDRAEERQGQTELQLLLSASCMRVFGWAEPFDHESSNLVVCENGVHPEGLLQAWDQF